MFCYLKAFNINQPFTNHMDKASRHIHFMHLMLALKPEEVYATKELGFQRCFVSVYVPCFHLVLRGLLDLHCLLHRHQRQPIFEPQCNCISSLLTHLEPEAVHQVWIKQSFSTQIKYFTYFFFCLLFFSFCFYLCFLLCFLLCLFFLLKFLYPGITAVCIIWQKKGSIMYRRKQGDFHS